MELGAGKIFQQIHSIHTKTYPMRFKCFRQGCRKMREDLLVFNAKPGQGLHGPYH